VRFIGPANLFTIISISPRFVTDYKGIKIQAGIAYMFSRPTVAGKIRLVYSVYTVHNLNERHLHLSIFKLFSKIYRLSGYFGGAIKDH